MTEPACSVLIATHNRRDTLLRCLTRLARSDVGAGALQVVVIDDGSTDDTLDALAAVQLPFAELVVRTQENAGPAAARNLGLGDLVAPITLFINDDTLVLPETVRAHLDTHAVHAESMVLGTFEFVPEFAVTPLGRMLGETPHLFPFPLFVDGDLLTADLTATCNLSVPTANAVDAGFDQRFTFAAEDVDFGLRLQSGGLTLRYNASARAEHDHHLTVEAVLRTARLRGFGAARLAVKHGRHPQLIEASAAAIADEANVRRLVELAGRELEAVVASAPHGEPIPARAYDALTTVFKLGNVLGMLDEPAFSAMARRAPVLV